MSYEEQGDSVEKHEVPKKQRVGVEEEVQEDATPYLLLIPDIITTIFAFSTLEDASRAREVCRLWADTLARIAIFNLPDWKGAGLYVDADRVLHTLAAFTGDVQKLTIKLQARDQGWGNQKGRVWFAISESAGHFVSNIVAEHRPFDTVAHEWREDNAKLDSRSAPLFMQKAVSGNHMSVWAHVGGGGGHQLKISDISVIVHYKPSSYHSSSPQPTTKSNCLIM